MKNNLLIAEFMGLEVMNSRDLANSEPLVQLSATTYLQKIQYDTSWDWLMTVVEKIESFQDPDKAATYNFKMEQSFIEIIHNHTGKEIVKLDRNTKFKAVYDACVEFINYWNE